VGDDQVSPRPCPQGAGQMPVPDALSQWATIGRKRADAVHDGVSAEQAMRCGLRTPVGAHFGTAFGGN